VFLGGAAAQTDVRELIDCVTVGRTAIQVQLSDGYCHISRVKAFTPPLVSSLTHWIRSIRFVLGSKYTVDVTMPW
jgi:hypothetical protein